MHATAMLPHPATVITHPRVDRLEEMVPIDHELVRVDVAETDVTLPPIQDLRLKLESPDGEDITRRYSTTSASSIGSSSHSFSPRIPPLALETASLRSTPARRLQQIQGHLHAHNYRPYLTPASTPILAAADAPVSRRTKNPRAVRGVGGSATANEYKTNSSDVREHPCKVYQNQRQMYQDRLRSKRLQEQKQGYCYSPDSDIEEKRNAKALREADSRYIQTVCFASLQRSLLTVNPFMPQMAATESDRAGWIPLKSNNVRDVENPDLDPLFFNKVDVMDSATLVIDQDTAMLREAVEFLKAIGQAKAAEDLASGVADRGTLDFNMPHLLPRPLPDPKL